MGEYHSKSPGWDRRHGDSPSAVVLGWGRWIGENLEADLSPSLEARRQKKNDRRVIMTWLDGRGGETETSGQPSHHTGHHSGHQARGTADAPRPLNHKLAVNRYGFGRLKPFARYTTVSQPTEQIILVLRHCAHSEKGRHLQHEKQMEPYFRSRTPVNACPHLPARAPPFSSSINHIFVHAPFVVPERKLVVEKEVRTRRSRTAALLSQTHRADARAQLVSVSVPLNSQALVT
ncbi:hypothetical protein SKAU_G00252820 [Synaphobranchus kaupii]|uniref:Uncharacterized protein n=1 Tax=Synaphobranchus kaupii TaxID=118154 RepID=A0A9Q1IS28_SYNKA|nr:hypothetical protein SKAU_G00252820 [Synaphobranchus kaupii]